jgi:transcriptional regulator with XRE-family HTH domain
MKERIREILKKENLTSAQFADKIGVQRSSISHILSGRNKPGFDFIQKIMLHFPELNAEWLITGTGMIYRNKNKSDDLFGDGGHNKTQKSLPDEQKTEILTATKQGNLLTDSNIEEKKIEKILVFFSDKTFREYHPED